jgi:hypothetical protein
VREAVREEAMAAGFTATKFLDCTAWQTLARRKPTLRRQGCPDSLDHMWGVNYRGKRPTPEGWSDQEVALRIVVYKASDLALDPIPSVVKRDLDGLADDYDERAEVLRGIAEDIEGNGDLLVDAHVANLEAAARYCEERAHGLRFAMLDTPGLVTRRNQGNQRARGYCALLAEKVRVIYGATLRRTVATITTCALNLPVPLTVQTIRDWIPDRDVS